MPAVMLAPWFVLAGLCVAARSSAPTVLGRYSVGWFVFVLAVTTITLLCADAVLRRATVPHPLLLGAVYLATYGVLGNNGVAMQAVAVPLVHASRLGIAGCFLWSAATAFREGRQRSSRPLLATGAAVLTVGLLDLAAPLAFRAQLDAPTGEFRFRSPVSLESIGADDVPVVGDSFVWGAGVSPQETFVAQLQGLVNASGGRARIYNLGRVGAGLPEYDEVLRRLGRKRRTVVCFYMNDMPERITLVKKVREALYSAGRTSLLMRVAGDLFGVSLYSDAHAYTAEIVRDYDPGDSTFGARWRELRRLLDETAREAARGAAERPLLVIFPIVCDFRAYPLERAHAALASEAAGAGYEVLDMLPEFRRVFPDGEAHLVAGNHFDAAFHRRVAEVLAEKLFPRAPGPGDGR
jgi:hypothetical protein